MNKYFLLTCLLSITISFNTFSKLTIQLPDKLDSQNSLNQFLSALKSTNELTVASTLIKLANIQSKFNSTEDTKNSKTASYLEEIAVVIEKIEQSTDSKKIKDFIRNKYGFETIKTKKTPGIEKFKSKDEVINFINSESNNSYDNTRLAVQAYKKWSDDVTIQQLVLKSSKIAMVEPVKTLINEIANNLNFKNIFELLFINAHSAHLSEKNKKVFVRQIVSNYDSIPIYTKIIALKIFQDIFEAGEKKEIIALSEILLKDLKKTKNYELSLNISRALFKLDTDHLNFPLEEIISDDWIHENFDFLMLYTDFLNITKKQCEVFKKAKPLSEYNFFISRICDYKNTEKEITLKGFQELLDIYPIAHILSKNTFPFAYEVLKNPNTHTITKKKIYDGINHLLTRVEEDIESDSKIDSSLVDLFNSNILKNSEICKYFELDHNSDDYYLSKIFNHCSLILKELFDENININNLPRESDELNHKAVEKLRKAMVNPKISDEVKTQLKIYLNMTNHEDNSRILNGESDTNKILFLLKSTNMHSVDLENIPSLIKLSESKNNKLSALASLALMENFPEMITHKNKIHFIKKIRKYADKKIRDIDQLVIQERLSLISKSSSDSFGYNFSKLRIPEKDLAEQNLSCAIFCKKASQLLKDTKSFDYKNTFQESKAEMAKAIESMSNLVFKKARINGCEGFENFEVKADLLKVTKVDPNKMQNADIYKAQYTNHILLSDLNEDNLGSLKLNTENLINSLLQNQAKGISGSRMSSYAFLSSYLSIPPLNHEFYEKNPELKEKAIKVHKFLENVFNKLPGDKMETPYDFSNVNIEFNYNTYVPNDGNDNERSSSGRNPLFFHSLYRNETSLKKRQLYKTLIIKSVNNYVHKYWNDLIAHTVRQQTHKGDDQLAPYYFWSTLPYVVQALNDVRSDSVQLGNSRDKATSLLNVIQTRLSQMLNKHYQIPHSGGKIKGFGLYANSFIYDNALGALSLLTSPACKQKAFDVQQIKKSRMSKESIIENLKKGIHVEDF